MNEYVNKEIVNIFISKIFKKQPSFMYTMCIKQLEYHRSTLRLYQLLYKIIKLGTIKH